MNFNKRIVTNSSDLVLFLDFDVFYVSDVFRADLAHPDPERYIWGKILLQKLLSPIGSRIAAYAVEVRIPELDYFICQSLNP